MVSTPRRIRLCIALIIANVVFIWGNSLLSAEVSSAISKFVGWVLQSLISGQNAVMDNSDGPLRKLAHLLEFACFGLLWCWYLLMGRKNPWIGMLPGLCTACVDETIQCFVPGRGPRVTDVAIDCLGVSLGIGAMLIVQSINKWRKKL